MAELSHLEVDCYVRSVEGQGSWKISLRVESARSSEKSTTTEAPYDRVFSVVFFPLGKVSIVNSDLGKVKRDLEWNRLFTGRKTSLYDVAMYTRAVLQCCEA